MATTVSGRAPQTKRITLDAVAGKCLAVVLPPNTRRCTLLFTDSGGTAAAGKFSRAAESDGAAMSVDAFPISSGSAYELTIATGGRVLGGETIYLSGSAAGYCHIDLEA